jgi:F-type H+-transporting ATPase subunit b
MDSTLHKLGEIVLNGLPTFFLVVLLNFYLKRTFFRPLERTLEKRYQMTEGARQEAKQALAAAEARVAEYEAALRQARAEMYAEQERVNRTLHEEQAAALEAERRRAEARIAQVRAELAAETEEARRTLAAESDRLADAIADTVLVRGRAA